MATMRSNLILGLVDKVTGPAKGVRRSIRGVKKDAYGANRWASQTMRSMGAAAAGYLAPAAVAAGAKQTITAAADFESALTGIQKKANSSAAETARIGEEAKALAESGKVAVPLLEILAAYERGAAAGLPIGELAEFAELSAKAADQFEMSAEDVGNAAAGFKTTMAIPMDRMKEYFGLINHLADSGIADENQIIKFLDDAGAGLKVFGLTAEQAAAYGSTLANIKMAPEKSARMMNSLTNSLLSPGSKKSAAALKAIVGNVNDFEKLLKEDANEALLTFFDGLKELDKFERSRLLTDLVGKGFSDEILRVVEASDELRRNLEMSANRSTWFDSLDRGYQLKLDDFWSRWQIFRNKMQNATIDLGSLLLPPAAEGLEQISESVATLQEAVETAGLIADFVSEKFGVDKGKKGGFTPQRDPDDFYTGPFEKSPTAIRAGKARAKAMRDLANKDKKAPALGAYGARDTEAGWLKAIQTEVQLMRGGHSRLFRSEPIKPPLRSAREAERDSLKSLREKVNDIEADVEDAIDYLRSTPMSEREALSGLTSIVNVSKRKRRVTRTEPASNVPLPMPNPRDGLVDIPLPMPNPRLGQEMSVAADKIQAASDSLPRKGSEAGQSLGNTAGRVLIVDATSAGVALGKAAAVEIRAASNATVQQAVGNVSRRIGQQVRDEAAGLQADEGWAGR